MDNDMVYWPYAESPEKMLEDKDAEIERLRERIANALDALNDDDISGATLILYCGVREAPDND